MTHVRNVVFNKKAPTRGVGVVGSGLEAEAEVVAEFPHRGQLILVDHQERVGLWALHAWRLGHHLPEAAHRARVLLQLDLEEDEAQAQGHADHRRVVPGRLLASLEDARADLALPQAGHGQADGAVGDEDLGPVGAFDHHLGLKPVILREIAQQDGLLEQRTVLQLRERDFLHVVAAPEQTVRLVRARAEVVHLAGVGVADAHRDDLTGAYQRDHATPAVGLLAGVGAGAVDGIHGEVDVLANDAAGDRQVALLADDAVVRELLAQHAHDDGLAFTICGGDPVAASVGLLALHFRFDFEAAVGCVLHGPFAGLSHHQANVVAVDLMRLHGVSPVLGGCLSRSVGAGA